MLCGGVAILRLARPCMLVGVTRYNMTSDPWSMHNLINNTHGTLETAAISAMADELHTLLHTWFDCEGDACP